jgi:basic amino acid/polyamine antiporter, APA family
MPIIREHVDSRLTEPQSGLVRTIGRWSLAALMINTIIGASMAGLPSLIAARLGQYSPLAYLVVLPGIAIVAACLAEVASQFREAGGPYLYARTAFGQFAGIQIGWLTWLTRIASASAMANLFMTYLSGFLSPVKNVFLNATILTLLIGFLATVNLRGVSCGNWLSNFFTVTKLTLFAVFIGAGLAALRFHPNLRVSPAAITPTRADWFESLLLMIYAYGGFEAALFVAGETRNPRKDAPVALAVALSTAAAVYVAVQYVVVHLLPDAGVSEMVAVDTARRFLGPLGVSLVTLGILVSAYGYLSANMLHTPRITFAMGERGDFPRFFAAIHPRFRTPHVSILLFAALLLVFSITGDYRLNAILGAVSRLFIYGCFAAALPVLRKQQPNADALRLPGGMLVPILALLFTGVLVTQMHLRELIVIAATIVLALLTWLWATRANPSLV